MIKAGLMDEPPDEEEEDEEPPTTPLKAAVSQAQVYWARSMIGQYPKKSKQQISDENGGISWAQLEHYAKMPLAGLPERKGQKALAKPNTAKTKATAKKVKGT
jgi:hypothetical protein